MKSNFIKTARLSLCLTQSQLAEKLKCKQSAVANWESGYRNPPKLVVKILKDMLNENENEKEG